MREREPHRTRAKNELKHNSNSPLVRAEAGAAARSRSVEVVVFDDQWRLETSARADIVRVVGC